MLEMAKIPILRQSNNCQGDRQTLFVVARPGHSIRDGPFSDSEPSLDFAGSSFFFCSPHNIHSKHISLLAIPCL
jgi:hypothetical protein